MAERMTVDAGALLERLRPKLGILREMARMPSTTGTEATRLLGKAEGVDLAIGFIEEAIRSALPVDDTADAGVSSERVARALQAAWNDFVGDTGCFPDAFQWHGGNGTLSADFQRGNFARFVAGWLNAALDPPAVPEARGENERPHAPVPGIDMDDTDHPDPSWCDICGEAAEAPIHLSPAVPEAEAPTDDEHERRRIPREVWAAYRQQQQTEAPTPTEEP